MLAPMRMSGKEVRAARKAIRLKQIELAKLCSIRAETLSRIESGKEAVPGYVDMIVALLERDEGAVRFAIERRKDEGSDDKRTGGEADDGDSDV